MRQLNELREKLKDKPFIEVINHVQCKSKENFIEFFESVVAKRGEGIMLREPGSYYTRGYSDSLRKYKAFFDTELLVTELRPTGMWCQQYVSFSSFLNFQLFILFYFILFYFIIYFILFLILLIYFLCLI